MEENPLLLQRQSHFAPQNKEDLIMGIIRAITQAIGGGLADQWLEVYEADDMGDNTVFTSGADPKRTEPEGNAGYGQQRFDHSCV